MKDLFLIISVIVSFVTPIIGIIAILKGNFRPQRMTRFLVLITCSIFIGSLLLLGDKNGLYLAIAQGVVALTIFILSIKYGIGGYTKFDIFVLILAILTLLTWKITSNNFLALVLSIIIDLITFTPTIIKAWKQPETEDWKFYLCDTIAGLFSILSISALSIHTICFPLYILSINALLVVIIIYRLKNHQ